MRPYEKKQTACVAREKVNWPEGPREAGLGRDLGARCPAEGTREARHVNKETQQMQILHHERQRAAKYPHPPSRPQADHQNEIDLR